MSTYNHASSQLPMLVEPHVKQIIAHTLSRCHQLRVEYFYFAFNITVAVVVFGFVGLLLYMRHKSKLTPEELYEREQKTRAEIATKLQEYKTAQLIADQYLITRLPHFTPM